MNFMSKIEGLNNLKIERLCLIEKVSVLIFGSKSVLFLIYGLLFNFRFTFSFICRLWMHKTGSIGVLKLSVYCDEEARKFTQNKLDPFFKHLWTGISKFFGICWKKKLLNGWIWKVNFVWMSVLKWVLLFMLLFELESFQLNEF